MLSKEEQEILNYMGDINLLGLREKAPTAADFKQIIDHYVALHKEIDNKLDIKKVFYNWFQVDCKPFKISLLNNISKWSNLFKNHLFNHVSDRYRTLFTPR